MQMADSPVLSQARHKRILKSWKSADLGAGAHPLLPTPSPALSTVLGTSYVLGDKLSEGMCMGTREPVPLLS